MESAKIQYSLRPLCGVFFTIFTVIIGSGCNPSTGPAGTTDGDPTAKVSFPNSGDALIVVDEDEGLGSATYFGLDEGDSVRPTRLIADAGDEVLDVVFDNQARPIDITFARLRFGLAYNDDGTFDLMLSDDAGDRFTEAGIPSTTAKVVTTNLAFRIDLDLDLCATNLIINETNKLDGLTEDELACFRNQQTALFVLARLTCLVDQGLNARLLEVQNRCGQQDDPAACVRRVEPWLTTMASLEKRGKEAVSKFVELVSRGFPRCVNDPNDSSFGAPQADTAAFEDQDMDNVVNGRDLCVNTPSREPVNRFGCSTSQIGAIDCSEIIDPDGACSTDGCCQEACMPRDPDCSTRLVGTVTGRITDADTGDPVIGATVLILTSTLSVTTDATGTFTINNVPTGPHQLVASADGFADNSTPITVSDGTAINQSIELTSLAGSAATDCGVGGECLTGEVCENGQCISEDCVADGFCNNKCANPFDADCKSNDLICRFGLGFCCDSDFRCDATCPETDCDCDPREHDIAMFDGLQFEFRGDESFDGSGVTRQHPNACQSEITVSGSRDFPLISWTAPDARTLDVEVAGRCAYRVVFNSNDPTKFLPNPLTYGQANLGPDFEVSQFCGDPGNIPPLTSGDYVTVIIHTLRNVGTLQFTVR